MLDTEGADLADIEITRAETADGGELWVWIGPLFEDSIERTWRLDADGTLRAHSLRSLGGFLVIGASAVEYEFTIVADPAPLTAPEPGSRVDLAELDLPDGLLLPE